MQTKQTNVQSAGIYSVLQTWTACETKLVRFFLKYKLKIKVGTSADFDCLFFYKYTGIFYYLQRGAFAAEVVTENMSQTLLEN